VIHGSEANLRPNCAAILSKILAIKLLPIINYEFFEYAESADDLLPEKFPDSGWSDSSDRPCFNPFSETLDR
jgi:hypothetical protein